MAHPALAYLERGLFGSAVDDPPALEGAIRFFEGAGTRGALELVGEEILQLLREGAAPCQICVVAPSHERWRAPLETAFSTLGIPYAIDTPARLLQTPCGQALLSLLRFAWSGADRPELCDFFVPAVVRRGDLTLAVSTNGASPALARRLRERLERDLGPEYARALETLRAERARLLREEADPERRRQTLERLAASLELP